MSRLGAKTYSRKTECKTSVQFDHLLSDKANKPSTAKVSVAAVHRWGMTSFTSIRKSHLNGQKDTQESHEPVKRMKTESQAVVPPPAPEEPLSYSGSVNVVKETPPPQAVTYCDPEAKTKLKTTSSKPNKFFKSGGRSKLGAGTNSSSKPDFDALRLSVPPSFYISNNSSSNQQTELHNVCMNPTKNGAQPMMEEKNMVLFGNLVCSEPRSVDLLTDISAPCDRSAFLSKNELDHRAPVSYPENFSELNFFLEGGLMDSQKLPLSEQMAHSEPLPTTSLLFSTAETSPPLSTASVISANTNRTLADENFDSVMAESSSAPMSLSYSLGSDAHGVKMVGMDALKHSKKPVCDSVAVSISNEKPNIELCNPSPELCSSQEMSSLSQVSTSSSTTADSQPKVKSSSRLKKIFNSSKKPRATYNHRHWQSIKTEEESDPEKLESDVKMKAQSTSIYDDDDFDNDEIKPSKQAVETKCQLFDDFDEAPTVCTKPSKRLYTVVRNVKQAYQVHESGETQEFNDDIEYLLEGLQCCNSIGTRCLSVLSLATKCMGPAFRIHLRAHGTMPKMFSALHDAPSDPNLSLCTATLLFVLSQDRLTMDIEASTLSLMLQLLETDPEIGSPEKELELILEDPALCAMQEKHREKVHQLCEQMQQKGHAKQLKLDNINTGILAMETLLSLTSRKAGDWFKEEMRILHGLDHIVDTITCCVDSLREEIDSMSTHVDGHLDKIRKIDRCLRVLENVTYTNFENQEYLLNYKDSLLAIYCLRLLKICKCHLLDNRPAHIETLPEETSKKKIDSPELHCLLSVLKVLLNITFENPSGCFQVGALDGLMETVLLCILQVPRAVPVEKRFDLLVLSLGVLINLVEHCSENRKQMMEMYVLGSFDTVNDGYEMLAPEALIEVMVSRLEAAQQSEEQADELLSSQELQQATNPKDNENAAVHAECLEETLMKTLQKAGKQMEHSMIAAYISFLMGCVIQNNEEYTAIIKEYVPDSKFDCMVEVLKKFMSFVSLAGALGNTDVKSIQRIIDVLSAS